MSRRDEPPRRATTPLEASAKPSGTGGFPRQLRWRCSPNPVFGFETVIATGGVSSGLDVARSVALGARAAGLARPVLRALMSAGTSGAATLLAGVEAELRAAMLLTASRDLSALRRAPRVLTGELLLWLDQLGGREKAAILKE